MLSLFFIHPFSYNPPLSAAAAAAAASGYGNKSAPYTGRLSAPPFLEYEQRVPSAITSISHPQLPPHHHTHHPGGHHNRSVYNDYSSFAAVPVGGGVNSSSYSKHKSYLSSTMISIPKSSSAYYSGTPALQEANVPYKHWNSFDGHMMPPNGYLPPKFQENVSEHFFYK